MSCCRYRNDYRNDFITLKILIVPSIFIHQCLLYALQHKNYYNVSGRIYYSTNESIETISSKLLTLTIAT